jgi:effector-binding domain-containing protein
MWVLFLFALLISGAYFLPKIIMVERNTTINAPSNVVFAQINDLHNWEKWSVWSQLDPNMKLEYINNGVGQGAGYKWESNNTQLGSGQLQITESVPYDSIVTIISFSEESDARSVFHFEENDSTTYLTWRLTYDLGYNPFARWMGQMMKNYIGRDFEKGLQNLNVVCDVQMQENSLIVELVELEGFQYAGIRKTVPFLEIGLVMGEMYDEISRFIESSGTEMAGMPFVVYHEMKGGEIDLECGIPVSKIVKGNNSITTSVFPSNQCAAVDYYGDYQQLEDAHTTLQAWIDEHDFKLAGPPFEFYITGPRTEQNPDNWLTKIYYPVR